MFSSQIGWFMKKKNDVDILEQYVKTSAKNCLQIVLPNGQWSQEYFQSCAKMVYGQEKCIGVSTTKPQSQLNKNICNLNWKTCVNMEA